MRPQPPSTEDGAAPSVRRRVVGGLAALGLAAAIAPGVLPAPAPAAAATVAASADPGPILDAVRFDLSDSLERSVTPAMATEGDDTYVAWVEDGHVAFSSVREHGTSEGTMRLLDTGIAGRVYVDGPDIAAHGDDVWVAWVQGTPLPGGSGATTWETYVARSTDRGATFGAPEQVSPVGDLSSVSPRVVLGPDAAAVVFLEVAPMGIYEVTLAAPATGGGWTTTEIDQTHSPVDFDVDAAGGAVHVVTAAGDVRYTRVDTGGFVSGPTPIASSQTHVPGRPVVAADSGTVAVAWHEQSRAWDGIDQIVAAVSSDGGQFRRSVLTEDAAHTCTNWICPPVIDAHGDRAVVVWTTDSGLGMQHAVFGGGSLQFVAPVGDGAAVPGGPRDVLVTEEATFIAYNGGGADGRSHVWDAAKRHGGGPWVFRQLGGALESVDPLVARLGSDYVVAYREVDRTAGIHSDDIVVQPGAFADRNLTALGVAAVQAPEAPVRLAEGHRTVFRARVRSGLAGPANVVVHWTVEGAGETIEDAQLVTLRPGIQELTYEPAHGYRPDPGDLSVTVQLDSIAQVPETDESDNVASGSSEVVDTAELDVLYVPLTSGDQTVPCSDVELMERNSARYLDAVLPIDDLESLSEASCATTVDIEAGTGRGYGDVLSEAASQLRHLQGTWEAIVVVTPNGWIADTVAEAGPGTQGLADVQGAPGIIFVESRAFTGPVVAHEIAHDRHWVTGDLDDGPPNAYHATGLPADGWWIDRSQLFRNTYDFMAPTLPSSGPAQHWVSAATWEHLIDTLAVPTGAAVAAAADGASLALSGAVAPDGTVALQPVERLGLPPTTGLDEAGELAVVYLDETGVELARTGIEPSSSPHASPDDRGFVARVPDVDGAATLVLQRAGAEVARVERSATPPTVAVTAPAAGDRAPAGGSVRVAWDAADADGDELTARVDVSTDGGTSWRLVRAGITGSELEVPVTRELSGELTFRVTVVDAWDAASAVSEPVPVTGTVGNGRIAFGRRTNNSAPVLWTVGPDGSGAAATSVAWLSRSRTDGLAWSPDGSTLAAIVEQAHPEIWLVDEDGSNARSLGLHDRFPGRPYDVPSNLESVVWSPDGTQLAFIENGWGLDGASSSSSDRIWLLDVGTGALTLVHERSFSPGIGEIEWGPDGRIWLTAPSDPATPYTSPWALWTVQPDGSGLERVLVWADVAGPDHAWHADFAISPANGDIALVLDDDDLSHEVWTATASGSGLAQLTDLPATGDWLSAGAVDWAPDGSALVVTAGTVAPPGTYGRNVLLRVDATDGSYTQLIDTPLDASEWFAAWQPLAGGDPGTPAPTVEASIAEPGPVVEGDVVVLDAAGSTAGAGLAGTAWDLDGDGEYDDATGATAAFRPLDDGVHRVAVEVTDTLGQSDTAVVDVEVANAAPVIVGAVAGHDDALVEVTATVTDAGADELTATVVVGDGTVLPATAGRHDGAWTVVASVAAADAGEALRIDVADGDGGTASADVAVTPAPNRAPTIAGGAALVTDAGVPVDVVLDATDPDGDPVALEVTAASGGAAHVLDGGAVVFVPADGFAGSASFEVVATDGRDRSAPVTVTVEVRPVVEPWPFGGFEPPVAAEPGLNAVNPGRTVPLKWSLGEDRGDAVLADGSPWSAPADCATGVETGPPEPATGALVHEPGSDGYTYEWRTDQRWAGTCRVVVVALADGTEHRARFEFR